MIWLIAEQMKLTNNSTNRTLSHWWWRNNLDDLQAKTSTARQRFLQGKLKIFEISTARLLLSNTAYEEADFGLQKM